MCGKNKDKTFGLYKNMLHHSLESNPSSKIPFFFYKKKNPFSKKNKLTGILEREEKSIRFYLLKKIQRERERYDGLALRVFWSLVEPKNEVFWSKALLGSVTAFTVKFYNGVWEITSKNRKTLILSNWESVLWCQIWAFWSSLTCPLYVTVCNHCQIIYIYIFVKLFNHGQNT